MYLFLRWAAGEDCAVVHTDTADGSPVSWRDRSSTELFTVVGGVSSAALLGNMILADADAGRGIVLIDPKGATSSPTSSPACPAPPPTEW